VKYNNQHAVITGASSGIGLEFARQLHKNGATVTLVARREQRLNHLASELNAIRPNSAHVFICDLASESCLELEKYLALEKVDILVSNAGRGSFGYFEQLNVNKEVDMVQLNLVAPLKLMHAVIPQMKTRKSGAIISVASIAAFQPLPLMSTYAATKSFNLIHAIGLRHELKEFGVKVITLCPGPTETEYAQVAGVPKDWNGIYHDSAESVVAGALRALDKNQAWITPGIRSRSLAFFARLLPLDFTSAISRRILSKAALKANLPD
jgi:uncharacterized protein